MKFVRLRWFARMALHGGSILLLLILVALPLNEYVWMLADDPSLTLATLPADPKEPAKRELVLIGCTLITLLQAGLAMTAKNRNERLVPSLIAAAALVTMVFKLL